MDQPKVLVRGDIKFPKKSYLVFLFSDGEIKVVDSSSIEYLGENQEEFGFKEVVSESILDVDVEHMELSIDNALVNNVRWFDVWEISDGKWKIKPKKYESRVSVANYLASIFTLGILGCVLLRKKGKEIERVAKNWDRAQQELCKWEFLGREVSELVGEQELNSWLSDVNSIRKYGDWQSIAEVLALGNKVKQIFGIGSADEVEGVLKNRQERTVSVSSNEQQLIDRLASAWGGELNDLVSHLDRWRRTGPLDQLEDRLESWDRASRMFGVKGIDELKNIQFEYERLKSESSKLQDVTREKDEWKSKHLLLNQELRDLAETEEDLKIVKKLRYWEGEWTKLEQGLENLKKYGGLDSVREKLELFNQISESLNVSTYQQAEQLKNRIKAIENRDKSLDSSSSENDRIISNLSSFCGGDLNLLDREIGHLVNKYGSLGSLEEKAISLEKELGDLIGTEDDKRIIRRFQNEGGLVQLERDLNDLREYGSYDSIKNQLNFAKNVSRLFGRDDIDSFRTLKNEHEEMQKRIKQLEFRLEEMGSENDFPIIQKLRSRYDGGWEELHEQLEGLRKYGDLESVREEMDLWRANRIKYESLQSKNEEQAIAIKALEEYKEKTYDWEREIKEFGSPEERKVIRKLKYYDGGLLQLERDIDNLENYGKLSSLVDQLNFGKEVSRLFGSSDIAALTKVKNETLEQIPKLKQKIQDLEEREKRWQSLTSSGQSLEYLESIMERKENESKTNKGIEFEQQIESILSEMDNGGADDNFFWKAQHGVEGSRADFLVEVKNKYSQNLKLVLECKRYGNYGDELGYLSAQDIEEDIAAKKRLIDQGIKQLCDYYDKNDAGVGLLVTDIDLRSIGKKDLISRIRRDDVPEKYGRGNDMNLLLVHVSCFRTLMIVIRFVMNVCKPDVEIDGVPEQMQQLYNSPDIKTFLEQVINLYNLREKSINQIRKRFETINKASSLGKKDCVKCEEVDKKLKECVDQLRSTHDFYSNTPLQLEGTDDGVVIEEEVLLEGEKERE